MRKRSIFALAALMIIVLAVLFALRPDEGPTYNGRSLYHWLDIAIKTNTPLAAPEDVETAYRAVMHIGTNGLPWMLKQVKRSPGPNQYRLGERISNLGYPWNVMVRRVVLGDASYVSGLALHGFDLLGTNGLPALGELSRIANRTNSIGASQSALIALWHIGNEALPSMFSVMTNATHPRRGFAASLIVETSQNLDTNTVATINALTTDPDPQVARDALQAMSHIESQRKENGAASNSPPE